MYHYGSQVREQDKLSKKTPVCPNCGQYMTPHTVTHRSYAPYGEEDVEYEQLNFCKRCGYEESL